MTPYIGLIVLYQDAGYKEGEIRDPVPAAVLGVRSDNRLDLGILAAGHSDVRSVPFSEELKPLHWSYVQDPNSYAYQQEMSYA